MKKYIFSLALAILWATISPFIAFKILGGSFTPEKEFVSTDESIISKEDSQATETDTSDIESSPKAEQPSNTTEKIDTDIIELLTAKTISEIHVDEYSEECQKALAVAIRSSLAAGENNVILPREIINIPKCVSDTEGIVMISNGSIVKGTYHRSSYKTTVSSPNGEKHLVSVKTYEPTSQISQSITLTKDKLKEIISELCPTAYLGNDDFVLNVKFDDENRCKFINVSNCAISAKAFADKLSLPSLAFEISEDRQSYVITVYGEGDGVGMSIEGAETLAKQGKTYEEILKTYYTNIKVEHVE